ncbi:hypothetical protein SDC9_114785 [bioreactor metagenome]|uniref:Uncharacterized protein n=1 Tax=bioreactor metagenome TaxID=1076179 RepID=A0A645BQZ1_9ZZZZ
MNKKMVLIEGEVTFKIRVATLVNEEIAKDEERAKAILEDLGYKDLDCFSECEVDYDNEVPVLLNEETCSKYFNDNLSRDTWKEIIQISKNLNGEIE